MLCLPRNVHFEVHKVLHLPRILHMEVAVPATKSAHGGSQSAAPATKSAHGGSQSAVPATNLRVKKQVKTLTTMEGRFRAWPETVSPRRSTKLDLPASEPPFLLKNHSISCVRYLSKTHFVLRLLRNLHMEVHKVLCLHEICTSRSTKCCTCNEFCTSRFKVLRLPRKLELELLELELLKLELTGARAIETRATWS